MPMVLRPRNILPHGHMFLTLCDLRGYENLLLDMSDADERLVCLIEIAGINVKAVKKYIFGLDYVLLKPQK